jgi:hypothetical protein
LYVYILHHVDVLSTKIARRDALVVFITRGLPRDKNQFHITLHGDYPLVARMLEEAWGVNLLSLQCHLTISIEYLQRLKIYQKGRSAGFHHRTLDSQNSFLAHSGSSAVR